MTREVNGKKVHLQSDIGILDSRTGKVHHEVICNRRDEKFFTELEG